MDLSAKLSEHTSIEDYVRTSHKEFWPIQHEPPVEVLFHARRHCTDVREPMLALIGPSVISSGWRCEELNKAVGGSQNPLSAHVRGLATDEQPSELHVVNAMNRIVKASIPYDKVILECLRGKAWIHIQSPRPGHIPRKLALMAWPEDGFTSYNLNDPRVKNLLKG